MKAALHISVALRRERIIIMLLLTHHALFNFVVRNFTRSARGNAYCAVGLALRYRLERASEPKGSRVSMIIHVFVEFRHRKIGLSCFLCVLFPSVSMMIERTEGR